ncbi:hypothetical protein BTJ39_15320 [Izhakiella australiensis]|uniref:Uncharacterized protein n=1 Tax=Izhakiella australiensis TaxID=1926881 RepID=A0A1S8YJW4_9GAMM|nr:DsrE family protein [Izhakiella australiensis]OON39016.1 hypothetical protein BTJ39_15320 [Izhakiella australiensis]
MRALWHYVVCALIALLTTLVTLKAPAIANKIAALTDERPQLAPGFWQTPTIKGYGKIHYLAASEFRPQPDQTYNIVFQVQDGLESRKKVNDELDHVARTVNLYVASGVPLSQLKFVVAIAGTATPVVLNNQRYHQRFGVDNPNLDLIRQLTAAGVKVTVCDQAVAGHRYPFDWVDDHVIHALSNLTTISTLEKQGYVLLPM